MHIYPCYAEIVLVSMTVQSYCSCQSVGCRSFHCILPLLPFAVSPLDHTPSDVVPWVPGCTRWTIWMYNVFKHVIGTGFSLVKSPCLGVSLVLTSVNHLGYVCEWTAGDGFIIIILLLLFANYPMIYAHGMSKVSFTSQENLFPFAMYKKIDSCF